MSEPLRSPGNGEGPLADAAARLERALEQLEAALSRTALANGSGAPPDLQAANDALTSELVLTRRRGRKLKAAAIEASQALGRAMIEVRRTLDEDPATQGRLDFALESEGGSGDEFRAGGADAEGDAARDEQEPPS